MKPRARTDRRFAQDPHYRQQHQLKEDRRKKDRRDFLVQQIIKPALRGTVAAIGALVIAAVPVLLWSLGIMIGGE